MLSNKVWRFAQNPETSQYLFINVAPFKISNKVFLGIFNWEEFLNKKQPLRTWSNLDYILINYYMVKKLITAKQNYCLL